MKMYKSSGENGKVLGYTRAIRNIKAYPGRITTAETMDEIAFVGKSMKEKVREWIEEGKVSKIDEMEEDPKIKSLDDLASIWGVGAKNAAMLYDSGIRTIEQLRAKLKKHPSILTSAQKVGLKYYEDLQERMPREEAFTIERTVAKAAKELYGESVQSVACGSYRRGKETCGDVDVLITRTDNKSCFGMLEPLVEHLEY